MRNILTATVAVLALALAGCSGGDDDGGGASRAGAGGGGGAEKSGALPGSATVDERSSAGESGFTGQDGTRSLALPGLGSRVVQTASVELSVRKARFDRAVARARTIAAGLGGFVVSSSATQGPDHRLVSGTLQVRVPAASYAEAMRALSALGRVEAREESGQDVSQEFVDLEARRRHLEAVETQLLQLLRKAGTVEAALAVQTRLDDVQLELEQVRGRLDYLDDQVSFATIGLSLYERGVAPVASGDGWGVVDAWERAARGFLTVVAWIFVASATVAPLLLLLALAYVLWRLAAKRRMRTAGA